MPSSYTPSLKLILQATGENNGNWGTLTNSDFTSLVDVAVAGYVDVPFTSPGADQTLSNGDGAAANQARYAYINMSSAISAARNVIVPDASKIYLIKNSTTGGFAITVKTAAGTGISVPNGKAMLLLCDGTNVVDAVTAFSSLQINSLTATTLGATTLSGTISGAGNQINNVIVGTTRINPRVSSTASTATLTPDISSFDQYNLTAQAVGLTVAAPTGTPLDGNKLIIRILDNATSQTISWNATYTAFGVLLPTATILSKTTYIGCVYNSANTRWDVLAVVTQA
jgi:hypothetical protein